MVQIKETSKEEKIAMYMKLPKKQLIEMLIECNRILGMVSPKITHFNQHTNINTIPCPHNFVQKDSQWKSCTHCGHIVPLQQEN